MRSRDNPPPTPMEDMGTVDSLPSDVAPSVPFQQGQPPGSRSITAPGVPPAAPSFGPPPTHVGEITGSLPGDVGRPRPSKEPQRPPHGGEQGLGGGGARWGHPVRSADGRSPDRETTAVHSYVAQEAPRYLSPPPPSLPPHPSQPAPALPADPRLVAGQPSGLTGAPPYSGAPAAVYHDSRAVLSGVMGASDAAAQGGVRPRPAIDDRPRYSAVLSHEYLDLMWFDEAAPRRVRGETAWADYLRDPPKTGNWVVGDEAEQPPDRIRDERAVRRALSRVPAAPFDSIDRLVQEAVDEDGVLDRPLVVLSGDLVMSFDAVEALKATVATAGHFAVADKKLKDAVDAAAELLAEGPKAGLSLVDNLNQRIRQVFTSTQRGVSSDYLETTVERILLDDRQYSKRNVLGGPQLVGELCADSSGPLPTYLGAELANRLPLFRRFRVRLLAEPHPPQDPSDGGHVALKALAIARVMPRRGRA